MTETHIFDDKGDFRAFNAAEKWCVENGFSIGIMDGRNPIGIVLGDVIIFKWHNLSKREIKALDGRITGDMRNGPVTIEVD